MLPKTIPTVGIDYAIAQNWPVLILWLSDENESISASVLTHLLLRQAGELSKYRCSVDEARGRAVLELNNGKALRDCADRTERWSTRDVVYSACPGGHCYREINC